MLSEAILAYGESVAQALLGVDVLYRRESGDAEGLVVVNMATDADDLQAARYDSYAEADSAWAELAQKAKALPEADRRCYYQQLAESTRAFLRWRSDGLPFAEQLTQFLHVPLGPASQQELDDLRTHMRRLLTEMGYSGDLQAQAAAWEAHTRVPADEVPGVLQALMDEAWDRTEQIMEIPAPKSDGMQVLPVSGVAFNARCNYLERKVELNVDPILTRPGLKHLTVHEGYPGHYVQFKLREVWYRAGIAPADGLLSVVNTASSTPFEGIADNGLQALNWIESNDDRVQALMNRYRAGIGTVAAWQLHAEQRPKAQVMDWLRQHALIGGQGWVANRMAFLDAPARAVLIWSYWWGEPAVTPVWERVPSNRRPDFIRYLYGRMHSRQTVAMFP